MSDPDQYDFAYLIGEIHLLEQAVKQVQAFDPGEKGADMKVYAHLGYLEAAAQQLLRGLGIDI